MTRPIARIVMFVGLLVGWGHSLADESSTQTVPQPVVLAEHADAVYGLVFSPDGTWLASGSYDKTIKIWNVDKGKVISTLEGHRDQVFRIMTSPDGDSLVSCSGDGSAIQWDVDSGKAQAMVEGHGDPMMAVTYSPDGNLIATAGFHIQLWKQAEEQWSTPHSQPFFAVAFSPDQSQLACGTENRVRFLTTNEGESLPHEITVQGMVYQVEFSPNGKWLIIAAGRELVVWDVKNQKSHHVSKADASALFAAKLTPAGDRVVTAGRERVVRVWNFPDMELSRELYGASESVLSVAISPDGRQIAAGTYDGKIYLWKL